VQKWVGTGPEFRLKKLRRNSEPVPTGSGWVTSLVGRVSKIGPTSNCGKIGQLKRNERICWCWFCIDSVSSSLLLQ